VQERPSEENNEERADADQHRCRSSVNVMYRLVEQDVVGAEPGDATDENAWKCLGSG